MRGANDITIAECINAIEETFPTQRQDNWDNSGLLVGDINITLRGVLISVDITEDVINEAIEKDCNLIISHHPIMFRGIKRLIGSNEEQRIIITAIKHNIVLYASHTCLDKSAEGTSRTLGNILNLNTRKRARDRLWCNRIIAHPNKQRGANGHTKRKIRLSYSSSQRLQW